MISTVEQAIGHENKCRKRQHEGVAISRWLQQRHPKEGRDFGCLERQIVVDCCLYCFWVQQENSLLLTCLFLAAGMRVQEKTMVIVFKLYCFIVW